MKEFKFDGGYICLVCGGLELSGRNKREFFKRGLDIGKRLDVW